MDTGGNIFVTWTSLDSNYGWQVYGQQITSTGQFDEAQFVVNNTLNGDQQSSSVAIDFLGNVIVVWSGNSAADSSGVSAVRYSTDLHKFEAGEHDVTPKDSQHNIVTKSFTPAETVARPVATHPVPVGVDDSAIHWQGLLSALDDLMFGNGYVRPRWKFGARWR